MDATKEVAVAAPLVPTAFGGLARIPARQLLALMLGAAAIIAVLAGSWMWFESSDYRVLYTNVSDRDGGTIIASLAQMNVPYRVADGGGAILVPAGLVHDTRLKLASQGLPRGGTVGFELVDNQKFGATQFQEQINYQRGLEGELAKSIQSLSAVQGARVHLAIPKPTVFMREQQGPSASVLLTLYPGKTLDSAQINGVLNLVASSVPDLATKSVSIVDQTGALLSKNGGEPGGLDPTQLSYVHQIEESTIKRITDILEPMVGRGNARVQVTADVDFSRVESMAESFKPNPDPATSAIRNQQINQSTTAPGAGPQGVPGALSNQPPAGGVAVTDPKAATVSTAGNAPTSTRKDQTTSYEVDKTIEHRRKETGAVKRMTAAVVVNQKRKVDGDGKPSYTALSAQEMEQINALVKEAMGFSKDRGDSLNVVNAPFNEPDREIIPETPWWKAPDNISMAKNIGRYGLFAALLGYILFGIVRPALRRAFASPREPELATIEAADGALALADQRNERLQLARKMARDDPKVVASVVKSWVTKDG